jgi:hypothetical protein
MPLEIFLLQCVKVSIGFYTWSKSPYTHFDTLVYCSMRNETITKAQATLLIMKAGSRIFTVTFVKKDKTVREMNCRLNVTKHLKGGTLKYNPSTRGLVGVYDMQNGGYKMVNINTIMSLKINGKQYEVED